MYRVVEVFQDLADKWRARVVLDETEAVLIKFNHYPTMDEIQTSMAALVAARAAVPDVPAE